MIDDFLIQVPKSKIHKLKQKTLHNLDSQSVLKKLKSSIFENNLELSNLLAAEILCSGGYLQLWDLVVEIIAESLALILMPNLSEWLIQRHKYLINLRSKQEFNSDLPNNQEVRNHFSQMISVLCIIPKNKPLVINKVVVPELSLKSMTLTEEYILLHNPISQLDKSTKKTLTVEDTNKYKKTLLEKFKRDLFAFIHCFETGQINDVLYWISQVISTKQVVIDQVTFIKVPKTISQHPIWIFWQFIYIRIPPHLNKYRDNLITLFIHALTKKNWEASTYLLFNGVLLYKYQHELKLESKVPIQDSRVVQLVSKINFIYRHLRKEKISL